MRQNELYLTEEERELIELNRAKGLHYARELHRAHILLTLDREIPETHILAVLGVGRLAILRTQSAYLKGGAEYPLWNVAQPGKPRRLCLGRRLRDHLTLTIEVNAWQLRRNMGAMWQRVDIHSPGCRYKNY